jgi:hypothetical protein
MLAISSHEGNANQNYTDSTSPLLEYPSLETPTKTGVGKDVGKKEPLYTAGGNARKYNCSGKKFGGVLTF